MSDESRTAELEARIAALEQGAESPVAPEGLRERMQRERQERTDSVNADRPDRGERRSGNPRPTSQRRADDLYRRSSTNLPAPEMPAQKAAAPQAGKLGDTIEIVLVDNGEFVTGNAYFDGPLTPVV